jgi:catechol 2,3-dioxygenase-like lactoylglutathione lyase family enzyme
MAQDDTQKTDGTAAPLSGLVPMIHVAEVERSAAFYELLGFAVGNRVPREGPMAWAFLYAPGVPDWRRGPNLMLTRTDSAIDAGAQEVLFYLYANDLVALREALLAAGLSPGGICYPEYLPKGEFDLRDPDGYLLMIAQNGPKTP